MLFSLVLVALAACLAFAAVGIVAHIRLKLREKKISLRGATSHLLGYVWLPPVAGVFVLVLLCFALLSSWTVIGPAEGVVISESIEQASRRHSHDSHDATTGEPADKTDDRAADRPGWIDAPDSGGPLRLVVVEGGQFSDPETARRDALNKAVRIVRDDFFAFPRPETVPITGVVSYNGRPLDSGEVRFQPTNPQGRVAVGRIASNGSYKASTFETGDGVISEGEYAPERSGSHAHPGVHVAVRKPAVSRKESQRANIVRGAQGSWQPPVELVQTHAVKETHVERIQRSTGNNDFFVYRAYHQVELSPEVRAALFPSWRSHTVDGRLWILGGLLGFVVLMLGTAATYLRLDALTGGNYRRRLKLASVTFLLAGGLGLAALLPIA